MATNTAADVKAAKRRCFINSLCCYSVSEVEPIMTSPAHKASPSLKPSKKNHDLEHDRALVSVFKLHGSRVSVQFVRDLFERNARVYPLTFVVRG